MTKVNLYEEKFIDRILGRRFNFEPIMPKYDEIDMHRLREQNNTNQQITIIILLIN